MEYLTTFHTHYGTVRFYKYCQKNNIPAKMLPVPREISASCGICVRFNAQNSPTTAEHEDMDCCYSITEKGIYLPVEE